MSYYFSVIGRDNPATRGDVGVLADSMKRDIDRLTEEVRKLRTTIEDLDRRQKYPSLYGHDVETVSSGRKTALCRYEPRPSTFSHWGIIDDIKWDVALALVSVTTMISVLIILALRR